MKARIIQVIVASCLLLQFSLQSCFIDTDETQNSGFPGTIKATVNTDDAKVDAVKVHLLPYALDDIPENGPLTGADVTDVYEESLVNGTYVNDVLTLNFVNPVPDKYLTSLLPVTDAKVTAAFN